MVIKQLEVLELILEDGVWFPLNDQLRKWPRFAFELLQDAFDLVEVDVAVPAGPNEVTGLEIALLRHHAGQECILSDVEDLTHRGVA